MNYLYLFKDFLYCKSQKHIPNILNIDLTIDSILRGNLSVARFGDGEIDLLLNINHPKYQDYNLKLVEKLKETLNTNDEKLLICIPKFFSNIDYKPYNAKTKKHWRKFISRNRKEIYEILDFNRTYGNTQFTRNYIDLENKSSAKEYFSRIRQIWNNREVIVIEGKYTRFGVGNDLLDNAKTIRRILCPEKNAFDGYEIILEKAISCSKEVLFLIALGPTATVLAKDLCLHGYQAIDIGHLDIEYEWYLSGTDKKVAIKNKWVNETNDFIDQNSDTLKDGKYEESIIERIEL